MYETLSYIGKELNDNKIVWGVGASILLNQFGLVETPNDIDILIDTKYIDKADVILKNLGHKKSREKTGTYSTKYFFEYIINDIDIDVMAGLAINHVGGTFEYIFDNYSISKCMRINGIDIPFTTLEDWYIIYQLIPHREAKVKLIEEYLIENGIKMPLLLERALRGNLPLNIRERINKLLSCY